MILAALLFAAPASAQRLIHVDAQTGDLIEKYRSGVSAAKPAGSWVGFSFERVMQANQFVGYFGSFIGDGHVSVTELLKSSNARNERGSVKSEVRVQLENLLSGADGSRRVNRELAVLVEIDERTGDLERVVVANVESPVDLKGKNLVWLGTASQTETFNLMRTVFKSTSNERVQKGAVQVVGFVTQEEAVPATAFLKSLVKSTTTKVDVRKAAVFALAWSPDESIGDFMVEIARGSGPTELRKSALYAIGNRDDPRSLQLMGQVVQDGSVPIEVRKAALYSVGNTESDEAVEVLKNVLLSDENTELRKAAAFALGNIGTPAARSVLVALLVD